MAKTPSRLQRASAYIVLGAARPLLSGTVCVARNSGPPHPRCREWRLNKHEKSCCKWTVLDQLIVDVVTFLEHSIRISNVSARLPSVWYVSRPTVASTFTCHCWRVCQVTGRFFLGSCWFKQYFSKTHCMWCRQTLRVTLTGCKLSAELCSTQQKETRQNANSAALS